jgi:hypothetical protein
MRRLGAALCVVALTAAYGAAQERPLPDRDTLFAAVKARLVRAQAEQVRYAYRERRSDLHVNPFGKVGTDGMRVYDVMPGPTPDVTYRTLIERDGRPVADPKPERIEERRREHDDAERDPIAAALEVLDFTIERREIAAGRPMIVVSFTPKPGAKAESRVQKLAVKFTGQAWVDEEANEVARVEAVTIDDLTFGFGLLARIGDGTHVTLTRAAVDRDVWLPTSVRFAGEGRAMLFRKLVIDYRVEWSDYRRVK